MEGKGRNRIFTIDNSASFAGKDHPTTSDKVYRSVSGDDAVRDLFVHGEVRSRATALGIEAGRKTSGHDVHWTHGEDGRFHHVSKGTRLIEAPHEVAVERMVTKDDVTGIYSKDEHGVVENRLEELRERLGLKDSK